MADSGSNNNAPQKVIIAGISGINERLPKWASEKTLSSIEDEIVKLVDILQKKHQEDGPAIKGAKKEVDEFEDSLKNLNDEQEETVKKLKELKDSSEKASDATKESSNAVKKFSGAVTTVTHSALGMVSDDLSKIFNSLTSSSSIIGGAFALTGLAVGEFIESLKRTTQTVLNLYDNGLTFQNSLVDLRLAASSAAMPLDEFAQLLVKNGGVIKALGTDGAKQFGLIAKGTRDLIKEQGYYGLNISQINDYTVDYLEILRKQGLLTRMTDTQRSQSSAEYIKELTSYSQILGKSRDQINKEVQDALKTPETIARLSRLGPEAQKVFTNTIAQISGAFGDAAPDLIKDFKTAALTPFGQVSEFSKALGAVAPELNIKFLNLAKAVGDGTISKEEETRQLTDFTRQLQNLSPEQKKNLDNMINLNSSLATGASEVVNLSSAIQGADLDKINDALSTQPDAFTKSVVAIRNTIDEIKAQFSAMFANFISSHTEFLNEIVANLKMAADWILDFVQKLMDPASRKQIIENISTGMTSILDTVLKYIQDDIEVKLGFKTAEQVKAERSGKPYDTTDQWNDSGFFGKLGMVASRGAGAIVDSAIAVGSAPADFGSWAGRELVNNYTSSPTASLTSQATPKVVSSPMSNITPLATQTTQTVIDTTTADKLQTLIDLQQQNNDLTQAANPLLAEQVKHLKAIKENYSLDSNIIR